MHTLPFLVMQLGWLCDFFHFAMLFCANQWKRTRLTASLSQSLFKFWDGHAVGVRPPFFHGLSARIWQIAMLTTSTFRTSVSCLLQPCFATLSFHWQLISKHTCFIHAAHFGNRKGTAKSKDVILKGHCFCGGVNEPNSTVLSMTTTNIWNWQELHMMVIEWRAKQLCFLTTSFESNEQASKPENGEKMHLMVFSIPWFVILTMCNQHGMTLQHFRLRRKHIHRFNKWRWFGSAC